MTEQRAAEESPVSPAAKRPWHAPTIEETDYGATEAAGLPGLAFDGIGTYSIV